jgi:Tfp pilus assembly protein PilX
VPQFGRIKARVRDESGFALVLALAIVVALGTAVASTTYFTTSNFHDSARSRAQQTALSLAEAGLNLAYSTLTAAADPTAATAVSSSPVPDVPMPGGFATYYGTYDSSSGVWTLTGVGKAYDTGHPGQFVVRAVHGQAQTGTGQIASQSNGAWRYIYSDDPNSCATLSNNTTINVPVYVQGSLCLNNSAKITGPAIQVGGKVTLSNQQTSIGTSTSPMTEIHIGHGCSLNGVTYVSPCSSAQRVYGATAPDATLTPMSKPAVDIAGWYRNAQPGPLHGCTSGSFPGGFDTNTTLDRSRSAVDLTPNQAYDCRVYDSTGNLVGRLSWTPGSPGSLVVQGTIFFDGNITMSQLVNAQYSGRATIYSSGTITLSNQVNLCPVTGCNSTNWDPNVNLLAFVSGDSTDQYGFSIGNNSTFEGAVYCVNDYTAGNSSAVWGPVIARQVYLQNSTFNSFPPIMNLMSGMPSSYTTVTTVKVVAGSWSS